MALHKLLTPILIMMLFCPAKGVQGQAAFPDSYSQTLDTAKALFDAGIYSQAIIYYDRALKKSGNNRSKRLRILRSKGLAAFRGDQLSLALETLHEAKELADIFGNQEALRDIHLNLSSTYLKTGEYISAQQYLKDARLNCMALQDSVTLAYTDFSQGIIYKDLGLFDLGAEYLYAAATVLEHVPASVREYTGAVNALGLLYLETNDHALAEEYLHRALLARKSFDYAYGIAGSYNNLGLLYRDMGQRDRAMAYFDSSLTVKRGLDSGHSLASTLANLGEIHLDNKDFDRAETAFREAYAIRRESNSIKGICLSRLELGKWQLEQGNYREADGHLRRALHLADSLRMMPQMQDALVALGRSLKLQQRFPEALMHSERLRVVSDSLINEGKMVTMALLNIEFETARKERKISEQAQNLQIARLRRRNAQFAAFGLGILLLLVVSSGTYYVRDQNRQLRESNLKINSLLQLIKHTGPPSGTTAGDLSESLENALRDKYDLTAQEYKVWQYLSKGIAQKEIANLMFISFDTLASHRKRLYKKLDLDQDLSIRKNVHATNLYREELSRFYGEHQPDAEGV